MSLMNAGEVLVGAALTAVALRVGLSTADPGETGASVAEPSDSGYSRQAVAWTDDGQVNGKQTYHNTAAVVFGPMAQGDYDVTHLFVAKTDTTILGSWTLTNARQIANGATGTFAAGDLVITVD